MEVILKHCQFNYYCCMLPGCFQQIIKPIVCWEVKKWPLFWGSNSGRCFTLLHFTTELSRHTTTKTVFDDLHISSLKIMIKYEPWSEHIYKGSTFTKFMKKWVSFHILMHWYNSKFIAISSIRSFIIFCFFFQLPYGSQWTLCWNRVFLILVR